MLKESFARRLTAALVLIFYGGAESAGAADGMWRGLGDTLFVPIRQRSERAAGLLSVAIEQDSRGFIWAAGEQGLTRWDGYHLRLYATGRVPDDGLHNHYFQALRRDAAGTLWVGTVTGELARYDPRTDRFTDVPFSAPGTAPPAIWAIEDDGAGGLWVATAAGLYRLDPAGRPVAHVGSAPGSDGQLPDAAVESFLRDRGGALWAGGRGGLFRRGAGGGRFTPVAVPAGPGQVAEVTRLMQDRAGRIWIGTRQSGAFVLIPGEAQARPLPIPGEDRQGATLEITALAEPAPGTIWLGTFGSGIVEVAEGGTVVRRIRHDPLVPGGLETDAVYALFRDRSGLVWVGSPQELALYRAPQGFVTLAGDPARRTGPAESDITAVVSRPDGSVWFGSERDGVSLIDPVGRRVRHVEVQRVQCMVNAPDGGSVIGTAGGLFRLDAAGARLTPLDLPGRRWSTGTSSLFAEGDVVWVGGTQDGLWEMRLGAGTAVSLLRHLDVPVLTNTRVQGIGASPDGRLAVGLEDGFMLIDRATGAAEAVQSIAGDPHSPAPGQVISFATDDAGRFWVGTNSAGLSVLTGRDASGRRRFQRIGLAEGLPNADINAMLKDARGRMWASTDDGLAEIDPASLRVRAFRAVDGVAVGTYWNSSGTVTREGALIFGGVGGATVVWPARVEDWTYRPPVVVTDVRVGVRTGDALAGDGGITVQSTANSLGVEFAALDFSAPDMNLYRYRLEGYDSSWVVTDAAHRVAAYTNLPPGDYRLAVQGTNRQGVWSESQAVLRVRVLAAWFQSGWFRLLEVSAAGLAVAGLVQARTLLLRRRQHELERQVTERTAELTAKQRELHEIAYVDTLTGLPNRRAFNETIVPMLGAEPTQAFALLLIDLDGFKSVNDTLGHDAGDGVLLAASDRLRESVREGDFVARLGGDEFVILLSGANVPGVVDLIAERVTQSVAAIRFMAGVPIKVGASVGVALFPLHGRTQEEIYKRADTALYAVKRSGRGVWRVYDRGMEVA